MHHSLSHSAKLAACVLLCGLAIGSSTPFLAAVAAPVLPEVTPYLPEMGVIDLTPPKAGALKLCHNGCEATGGALGTTLNSAQTVTLTGHSSHVGASESLWGNLLLSMAYQRDPEIQKYARKVSRINQATLLAIFGMSGLGLTQSLVGLANVHGPETLLVSEHQGGEAHLHTEGESKTSSVMGIVGSSATLATIGFQTLMNRKYSHRISHRQAIIKTRIESILEQLKDGEAFSGIENELLNLVGPVAAQEFSELWQATHPSIDAVTRPQVPSLAGENPTETGL